MFHSLKKNLLTISALLLFQYLYAQHNTMEIPVNQIEAVAERVGEDPDLSAAFEQTEHLRKYPVNLNTPACAVLMSAGLLNALQYAALQEHLSKNGALLSVNELQAVPGFDSLTIAQIKPYVAVTGTSEDFFSLKNIFRSGEGKYTIRYRQILEKSKGYASSTLYQGSPFALYNRISYETKKIRAGLIAEKDAGESLYAGMRKSGFDYYSAHLFITHTGAFRTMVAGDYQFEAGQGLVCWSGLSLSKSADIFSVKQNAAGLRPHTATDENRFMRGAAISLAHGKWVFTGLFSSKKRDANSTLFDLQGNTTEFSSFQESGYHRTNAELADRKAVKENIVGGRIVFYDKTTEAGVTLLHTRYDAVFRKTYAPYNRFDFSGNHNLNVGFDYSQTVNNVHLFGETAISRSRGYAMLNGVMASITPWFSIAFLHRTYSRNYHALLANAVSENTEVKNEQGFFSGIKFSPSARLVFDVWSDIFIFPWLKYTADTPSRGREYSFTALYTPSRKTLWTFRYHQSSKMANGVSEKLTHVSINGITQKNYRIHLSYQAVSCVELRNRIEWITCVQEVKSRIPEHGFLFFQDVIWKPASHAWGITARYALFESGSYATRMYAYEQDVPGSFSIPAYYYRGSRSYLFVHYRIIKPLDVWLRLSQTLYTDRNTSGSGTDELPGPQKTEIHMQARLLF